MTGKRPIVAAGILLLLLGLTGCGAAVSSQGESEETETVSSWETIPETEKLTESDTEAGTENTEKQEENGAVLSGEQEEDAEVQASEVSGIDGSMTGTEKAKELVSAFMKDRGLNSGNFAVAYQNLVTGEVFYYNELKQWDACSTYKFPLNLLYYDMEVSGQITGDTILPGTQTPLSECHHQSLEFSNNDLSEAMMDNLGSYDVVKQNMRKYFTLTDAEIDNSYYHHNYFCARMMMDCAAYLYQHQNEYPDALSGGCAAGRVLPDLSPGSYHCAEIRAAGWI